MNPRTHRLAVDRARWAPVDVVLDTRSFLLHDLAHYAVEAEARIDSGFWGLLAAGVGLEDLRESGGIGGEGWKALLQVERAVVLLQKDVVVGPPEEAPGWWDDALLGRASSRMRQVRGAWRKVKQGEALVLTWPPGPPRVAPARR